MQGELAIIKTMTTHDIECVQASLKTLAHTAQELAREYKQSTCVRAGDVLR
jgi:hypothetical protein